METAPHVTRLLHDENGQTTALDDAKPLRTLKDFCYRKNFTGAPLGAAT